MFLFIPNSKRGVVDASTTTQINDFYDSTITTYTQNGVKYSDSSALRFNFTIRYEANNFGTTIEDVKPIYEIIPRHGPALVYVGIKFRSIPAQEVHVGNLTITGMNYGSTFTSGGNYRAMKQRTTSSTSVDGNTTPNLENFDYFHIGQKGGANFENNSNIDSDAGLWLSFNGIVSDNINIQITLGVETVYNISYNNGNAFTLPTGVNGIKLNNQNITNPFSRSTLPSVSSSWNTTGGFVYYEYGNSSAGGYSYTTENNTSNRVISSRRTFTFAIELSHNAHRVTNQQLLDALRVNGNSGRWGYANRLTGFAGANQGNVPVEFVYGGTVEGAVNDIPVIRDGVVVIVNRVNSNMAELTFGYTYDGGGYSVGGGGAAGTYSSGGGSSNYENGPISFVINNLPTSSGYCVEIAKAISAGASIVWIDILNVNGSVKFGFSGSSISGGTTIIVSEGDIIQIGISSASWGVGLFNGGHGFAQNRSATSQQAVDDFIRNNNGQKININVSNGYTVFTIKVTSCISVIVF